MSSSIASPSTRFVPGDHVTVVAPYDNGRDIAKFVEYSLTRPGRRYLGKETENWARLSAAISQVVRLKEV